MENFDQHNLTQMELELEYDLDINFDSVINSLSDLFNKRDNEIWKTITKYDGMRKQMQKGLKINEFPSEFAIDEFSELINYMNEKVNELKCFMITKNEETQLRFRNYREKQMERKRLSLFSFEENDHSELNFCPAVTSTCFAPVNNKLKLTSSAVSHLRKNEVDAMTVATKNEYKIRKDDSIGTNFCPALNSTFIDHKKGVKFIEFKCKTCKKFYLNQESLNCHMNAIHRNPKSFEREIYGKKFDKKYKAKIHQRTNDIYRPNPFKYQQFDYAITDEKRWLSKYQKSLEY